MKKSAVFLTLAMALNIATACANDNDMRIFGWVEKAAIEPWGAEVKVKLDTGALTSSIQAEEIEEFERDDEDWVRFTVEVEDESSDEVVSQVFERPVYRRLHLRGAGGSDHRNAVIMEICIGDTVYRDQFSLEDRDDLLYPVLLGRRTIQHLGAVDVTATFLHEPDCKDNAPVKALDEEDSDEDIGI